MRSNAFAAGALLLLVWVWLARARAVAKATATAVASVTAEFEQRLQAMLSASQSVSVQVASVPGFEGSRSEVLSSAVVSDPVVPAGVEALGAGFRALPPGEKVAFLQSLLSEGAADV